MKSKLILCLIALLAMGTAASAQGLLKKLQKGVEQVDNAVNGKKKTNDKTKNASTQRDDDEDAADAEGGYDEERGGKSYPDFTRTNLFKGRADLGKQLGDFKKTASTHVVQMDKVSDLWLGGFSDGRVFVRGNANTWYCLDNQGKILKTFKTGFSGKDNMAFLGGEWPHFADGRYIHMEAMDKGVFFNAIVYDKDFKEIKRIGNAAVRSPYKDGVAVVYTCQRDGGINVRAIKEKNSCLFIDTQGNQVWTALSAVVDAGNRNEARGSGARYYELSEGLAPFYVAQGENGSTYLWGFRDAQGKVVVPAKYEEARNFYGGLAAVAVKEQGTKRWGFIDKTGRMVIEPKFTVEPSRFDPASGLALVSDKERNSYFMDKQGSMTQVDFKGVTPFCNGKAVITTKWEGPQSKVLPCDMLIDSRQQPLALVGDWSNGQAVNENRTYPNTCFYADPFGQFENRSPVIFWDNRIYLNTNGMTDDKYEGYALIDDSGNAVIMGLSGVFTDGLAPVKNKAGVGYVNMKGEWVIKFEENKF
mgnify:FL=1